MNLKTIWYARPTTRDTNVQAMEAQDAHQKTMMTTKTMAKRKKWE